MDYPGNDYAFGKAAMAVKKMTRQFMLIPNCGIHAPGKLETKREFDWHLNCE